MVAGLAMAVLVTVPAGAVPSTDIYVTGKVMSRVSGTNASLVRIAWDYKCLGQDGGNVRMDAQGRPYAARAREDDDAGVGRRRTGKQDRPAHARALPAHG